MQIQFPKQSGNRELMEHQNRPHCLIFPYPGLQGHINPMLQFARRLLHKQVGVSLITTRSNLEAFTHKAAGPIPIEAISDGFDDYVPGRSNKSVSVEEYLESFRRIGSETLADLVGRLREEGRRVLCIIYDPFMPWVLDVAKQVGSLAAMFFTQSCAVDYIYYLLYKGEMRLPLTAGGEKVVPGLPPMETSDLPSFLSVPGSYPGIFQVLLDQFSNGDRADWVLCNTFYDLEKEVVDWMAKLCPLRAIGPTIPSMYLDKRLPDDRDYGLSLYEPNTAPCLEWLNRMPTGSVVYVAFGSIVEFGPDQMNELAWGLIQTNYPFLWVIKSQNAQANLPKDLSGSGKGLVVSWSPQLDVLAHGAMGCFMTHCGWNSTLEALSQGVPMVAMPQWTDQSTNAKCVEEVWRVGLRVRCDGRGMVGRGEVERCVREVMEGERGRDMKRNAERWSELAKKAVGEGGSSDASIDEFVAALEHP